MTRSARIERIASIEEEREREAARAFAQARESLAERETMLAQLEGYQREYAQADRLAQAAGTSVVALQDYRIFLEKLSTAIGQQRSLVQSTRDSAEQLRQALQSANRRSKSLSTAAERYRLLEARSSARQEQRLLDEIGALRQQLSAV